jgi:AAA+ superfamily predicted ATPase
MSIDDLFEREYDLPDRTIRRFAERLVGFDDRYQRLHDHLNLMVNRPELEAWSQHHYGRTVNAIDILDDRYPLVVFHGDVGTGKTATAEATANRLTDEDGLDAHLFVLSTRVRGDGHVGQMSLLLGQAFDTVFTEAGKARHAFLIIDEADTLAGSRNGAQQHHEDKAGVNTLIQKVDQSRRYEGRVLIFLCTNRFSALDPAITRRTMLDERFDRPNSDERRLLLEHDLDGLGISPATIRKLVDRTAPDGDRPGLTYSDLRTRLLPDALRRAFPDRPLIDDDLFAAADEIAPTAVFLDGPA